MQCPSPSVECAASRPAALRRRWQINPDVGYHPPPPIVRLRTFFVTFFLAAVYRPILGLDFLSAHGLLVDPVSRQVLDSKSLKPLSKAKNAAREQHSKFVAALCSIVPMVRSLLASFPRRQQERRAVAETQDSPHH